MTKAIPHARLFTIKKKDVVRSPGNFPGCRCRNYKPAAK